MIFSITHVIQISERDKVSDKKIIRDNLIESVKNETKKQIFKYFREKKYVK